MNKSISTIQFQKLAKFHSSSWAIWSDRFNKKDSVEFAPTKIYCFLLNKINLLKNNIVLLGLNHSSFKEKRKEKFGKDSKHCFAPFETFHTVSHAGDGRLKRYIQDENLQRLIGSYMTNLSERIDTNSKNVNIITRDFNSLYKQLEILDTSKIEIICFGQKVYYEMKKYFHNNIEQNKLLEHEIESFSTKFKKINLKIYHVYHYSSRRDCPRKLQNQLRYINDKIITS